jgi:S-DNA-T family DNA segregation ATPase FtsK/SpoIIIE
VCSSDLTGFTLLAGMSAYKLWSLHRTRWQRDGYLFDTPYQAEDELPTAPTSMDSSEVVDTLANYGLKDARHAGLQQGPVLTRHLISLPTGTKLGKLPTTDIARDLGAESITIDSNAGRGLIGVDIPRPDRQEVKLTTVLTSTEWKNRNPEWRLPVCPGVDQFGVPVVFNLSKAPHLVVGGTTDSGKSVFVNAMILSLMDSGADFRLMIADGKGIDFAVPYAKSAYLLHGDDVSAIETEVDGIRHQVLWLAREMDRRYREQDYPHDIIFLCDELADITLQDDKEKTVTKTLARLAQKARGARIHLILITQYPKADVLHPLVAANTPSRAGMMVGKDHESRVIIDDNGCEELQGFGDCVLVLAGQKARRIHGANVTATEMQR